MLSLLVGLRDASVLIVGGLLWLVGWVRWPRRER